MKLKRLRQKGKAFYYDHGGKPRRWEALGSDRAEALRKYADIERGQGDEVRTAGQLVSLYIAKHQHLTVNTLRAYRTYQRVLVDVNASAAPIMALDQGHMNQMIDEYEGKHTARNTALFVKTVYAWAVSRGYIRVSPFTGMRLRGTSRRKRYLTNAEFNAAREKLNDKFRIAADLAYMLGLRVSEIRALKFSDFKDGVVKIAQKKTKNFKFQQITPDVQAVLDLAKALPGAVRGLHVICNRKGQPYSEAMISKAFQTALQDAGIKDSRFHDIRAKSASDERETATDRLGHESAASTPRYLRKPVIAIPIGRVNVEPSTKQPP